MEAAAAAGPAGSRSFNFGRGLPPHPGICSITQSPATLRRFSRSLAAKLKRDGEPGAADEWATQ